MARVRVGIIGLGQIGIKYDLETDNSWKENQVMTHVGAARTSELFEIEYLVDENEKTLKLAKQLFPEAKCLTLNEALEFPAPDMLIIATPTCTHLAIVSEVKKSWNPRVFLIEKPMGVNSHEATGITEILSARSAFVFVNYFRRFLPHTRSLRESPIFFSRGHLKKVTVYGYGTLGNIFSHFIDLLVFFEGSEILNLGRKLDLEETVSTLFFIDPDSGIHYSFIGLGEQPRECEMRLEYDHLTLIMSENGRRFDLFEEGEKLVHSEYLSRKHFSHYQSDILAFISENLTHLSNQSNMQDSIKIHQFFESIACSHG